MSVFISQFSTCKSRNIAIWPLIIIRDLLCEIYCHLVVRKRTANNSGRKCNFICIANM